MIFRKPAEIIGIKIVGGYSKERDHVWNSTSQKNILLKRFMAIHGESLIHDLAIGPESCQN